MEEKTSSKFFEHHSSIKKIPNSMIAYKFSYFFENSAIVHIISSL
jgi:hypothetical protein